MNAHAGTEPTKLLIVDDHPLVRSGIQSIIQMESDLTVCGEAEDHDEAMKAIAKLGPDLVLVDISLKDSNGLSLLKDIKQNYP
ncbi:MAG: response regulator transcription factor, partial [Candidatus Krumholzibacteria bacterium]|nr:response regulator transcription factor [Candidatus Krumholzibacteria bacterium]